MNACGIQIKLLLKRVDFTLSTDLQLPAQGVTVLFGPSGSGKTTILRCLAGLEQAHGQVTLNDQVWLDSDRGVFVPTWQRDLGYVFQEASLFAHLSVQQNLQFGVKRIKRPGAVRALSEAIDLLGIGHLLQRDTVSLSGGERQRVAIARALAMQPKLLLLDEPLASLDQSRREEILPWLERMHTSLQIPLIYVTHSMQELTRLADYAVLMQAGCATLHGSVTQALADPNFAAAVGSDAGSVLQGTVACHDEVFHLMRIDLVADGQMTGELWVRQQPMAPGTQLRVHLHANDVSLSREELKQTSIQNCLQGIVQSINPDSHPAHRIVRVLCQGQIVLARVTARAVVDLRLDTGVPVWCQIKSVAVLGNS